LRIYSHQQCWISWVLQNIFLPTVIDELSVPEYIPANADGSAQSPRIYSLQQ
jgi:hypothetical protein